MATMTKMRTLTETRTGTWESLFPNATNNPVESLLFVKKLLAVAVSNITYLRAVFPESAFGDRKLDDITLKILREDSQCPGAYQVIQWVKGCFDALDKQYLRMIVIALYANQQQSDTALETYSFRFSYDKSAEIDIYRNSYKIASAKSVQELSIKKATVKLLRTIIVLTQTLDNLPNEVFMTMKLLYYDGATPSSYEPNGFRSCEDFDFKFNEESYLINVGKVETPYHDMQLRIKAPSNHFEESQHHSEESVQEEQQKQISHEQNDQTMKPLEFHKTDEQQLVQQQEQKPQQELEQQQQQLEQPPPPPQQQKQQQPPPQQQQQQQPPPQQPEQPQPQQQQQQQPQPPPQQQQQQQPPPPPPQQPEQPQQLEQQQPQPQSQQLEQQPLEQQLQKLENSQNQPVLNECKDETLSPILCQNKQDSPQITNSTHPLNETSVEKEINITSTNATSNSTTNNTECIADMDISHIMLRCPCGVEDDEGDNLLYCFICKYSQHGLCFGILNVSDMPNKHICELCATSDKTLTPTDTTLVELPEANRKEHCLWRKCLKACSEMKTIMQSTLTRKFQLSPQESSKLINRLVLEEFISPLGRTHQLGKYGPSPLLHLSGLIQYFNTSSLNVCIPTSIEYSEIELQRKMEESFSISRRKKRYDGKRERESESPHHSNEHTRKKSKSSVACNPINI